MPNPKPEWNKKLKTIYPCCGLNMSCPPEVHVIEHPVSSWVLFWKLAEPLLAGHWRQAVRVTA